MKYLKTVLFAVAALILIIVLTIKIYYHYDLPEYNGVEQISGIIDTVNVFTDEFGVPHIYAKNNNDLFCASGYIIARERLFQLSLLKAIMHGELSSILGDKYNEHDLYIKQHRNRLFSSVDTSAISSENLSLIESYCSGINSYVDDLGQHFPIEFKLTKSSPTKWSVNDAVNMLSLMTNDHLANKRKEFVLKEIDQYFGEDRYAELSSAGYAPILNKDSLSIHDLRIENDIFSLFGATGSLIGSDIIIIPTRNKPLLVFDDIWDLQQPAKWFDIHLNGGNFNIEGSVLPGFPLPIVGKNAKTAFAFTGNLSFNAVNAIFNIASDTDFLNLKDVNNNLYYADTTGFYSGQYSNSQHFELLKAKLDNSDILDIDYIVSAMSGYINTEKVETIQFVIESYLIGKTNYNQPIEALLEWDGDESNKSEQALLANLIYKNLIYEIFKDELALIGNDIFNIFIKTPKFAEKSLIKVLYNSKSSWLDNINTIDYNENLSDIIDAAVDNTLNEIQTKFGSANWQWGEVNQPSYKHVLSDRTLTFFINGFNVGPVVRKGSNSSVSISEYNYTEYFDVVSGRALCRIFDLSDMSISYSILSSGQSGLPKSPYYSDQVELFSQHEFREIEFNSENIVNNDRYQKLILYPTE